jgi:DNA-binding CsgD family transcriptional regulator
MKSSLVTYILLNYQAFVECLRKNSAKITRQELIIAILLRAGLSSSEIASRLHCSLRTVENHRYRLRQKLRLDTAHNLSDYLRTLDGEDPMKFFTLEYYNPNQRNIEFE